MPMLGGAFRFREFGLGGSCQLRGLPWRGTYAPSAATHPSQIPEIETRMAGIRIALDLLLGEMNQK